MSGSRVRFSRAPGGKRHGRMQLTLVGLSHKTAPIEIREKLTFPAATMGEALAALSASDAVSEALILSTCNRTEVYAVGADGAGMEAVIDFLCDRNALERHELVRYLYEAEGHAVVKHLFRVVSSLDSMVVGEAQVLHQVKEAYDLACEAGTVHHVFHKLFRQSFEVGKRVRTETAIGEAAVSISYAAVELAKKVFDTLEGRTILVVGAGKMSELTAKHLVSQGVRKVYVANRTYERAVELAERFEGTAIPYEELFERMHEADIVISSTSAPGYVIDKAQVAEAMRGRRAPLFLIDIALPRDVDPAVNDIPNAFVYDIDDLSGVVNSNLEERMREAERAEVIIGDELRVFEAWLESMEVVPTIAAIRANAEEMRAEEYAKALKRLGTLSEADRATVDALSQAIVNKMLHGPTTRLREAAGEADGYEYVETARRLYGLAADHEKAGRTRGIRSLLRRSVPVPPDETGDADGC
jgi:glutamyl-tRNA reductase